MVISIGGKSSKCKKGKHLFNKVEIKDETAKDIEKKSIYQWCLYCGQQREWTFKIVQKGD
jgi:hypothetical protein